MKTTERLIALGLLVSLAGIVAWAGLDNGIMLILVGLAGILLRTPLRDAWLKGIQNRR